MKVGIISLGLIGGSILKALSNNDFDLYCVTGNKESVEKAKTYGAISSDNIEILKECDVVFVCSPICVTMNVLDQLETVVSKDCVVLDVASVKEFIMKKDRPYKFIGSHPMAGTAENGFDASSKDLFAGAKWVFCLSQRVLPQDVEKVKVLIDKMGAKIIFADPKEHDLAVALISHAPMYVSQAIFEMIKNNELAKKLASSGFRDMTRLAMSNTQMAEDMLNYNGENISISLNLLKQCCLDLKDDYRNKIEKIAEERKNMYSSDGKNVL